MVFYRRELNVRMVFTATPESVVAFSKKSVSLVCSWPPSSTATRLELLRFRLRWWIALVFLLQLFFPLINGIWNFRDDAAVFVNAILWSCATAQAIIKTALCNFNRDRMQVKLYLSTLIV